MSLLKISDHLWVPEDFANDHHYYADAEGTKEYTGITSTIGVLAKPALYGWYAKMAIEDAKTNAVKKTTTKSGVTLYAISEEVLDKAKSAGNRNKEAAAEHGTDAHALVEEYIQECLKSGGHPLPQNGIEYDETIKKFVDWAKENVAYFLFSERRMADPAHFIAGTADFGAVMHDGKKLMGDFKTSSGIYGIDYWLQVSAYRMLAESEGDDPYDGFVITRLGRKDGKFEAQYLYEYETFRDAFLACLTLYRANKTINGLVSK